jgi:hypothetical protein
MSLDLTNTAQALAEYDKTYSARLRMLDEALTDAAVNAWGVAVKEAVDKVRRAFYEDTKDRNSLCGCMATSISYLRVLCDNAIDVS